MAVFVLALVGVTSVAWFSWNVATTNSRLHDLNDRLQRTNEQLQERNNDLHKMNEQMDAYKKSATDYAKDLPSAILFLNNRESGTIATLTQSSPASDDDDGRGKALSAISEADIAKTQYADIKNRYLRLLERDSDLVERLRSLSRDDLKLMKASAEIQSKMLALQSNDLEARKRHGRTAISLAMSILHKAQESQVDGCDLLLNGAETLAIDDEGRTEALDLMHRAGVEIGGNESELAAFSQENRMLRMSCAALSMLEEAAILNSRATIELGDRRRTDSLDELRNARNELEKAAARAKDAEDYLQRAAPNASPQPLVILRVGAMSHARRAVLLLSQSRALAAEDAGRKQGLVAEALSECEAAYGLRETARRNNDTSAERDYLASQAGQCGEMFEQQKSAAKARQYYERQVELRRGLVASRPADGVDADQARRQFESALIDAGYLERTQGDKHKAVTELDECVKDAEDLVTRAPRPINYHQLFYCYAQRGYLARDLNQYADMRDNFRKAVSSLLEAQGDPAFKQVPHEMVESWKRIAAADENLGDLVDELDSYEHAVDFARGLYRQRQDDEIRKDLIDALGGQSFALVLNRQFAKAVEVAEEALALNPATKFAGEAVKGSDNNWIKVNRAHGLWFEGRKAEAEKMYAELKDTRARDIVEDFDLFLKLKLVTAEEARHIQALVGAPGTTK